MTIVKITDFGVSKELIPFNTDSMEPKYFNQTIICPELIRFGFTMPQSDLYHIGLILLSLKLGWPPINPQTNFEEIQRLCCDGYPKEVALKLNSDLGNKIAKLLRRRFEYRYNTALDAWDDFRSLLAYKSFN